ncbi:hypothetical protein [Candidatus Absconditicoccus praedator]|uniref:hypothetical protein n=1 Tax=Candidatus Absconditicoccus praedator TaxID=2735562 RepID=UPI001E30F828|nr:hypothetical protein [Candidatus Absconditicoccus praedator]UFX82799.1 hypothetical protein HLG78_01460 [Candidatus Absconditicoccus praedator]
MNRECGGRYVSNGIPQGPFVNYYNVSDERFTNMEGEKPEKLIKSLMGYIQRSVGTAIIPEESFHVVLDSIGKDYMGYLSSLKGISLSKENFIKLSEAQDLANQVLSRIDRNKRYYSMNFFSEETAQKLMAVFQNSDMSRNFLNENLGLGTEINQANSKVYLQKKFGKFMVNGTYIDFQSVGWEDDLRSYFYNAQKMGYPVMLRLDRSVSGLGNKKLESEKDLNDFVRLVKFGQLNIEKSLVEVCLPEGSMFMSPSCQTYVNNSDDVEVFSFTDQLLEGSVHEGNVQLKGDKYQKLKEKMSKISKEIVQAYSKELSVKGFAGVDFMLVDLEEVGDLSIFGDKIEYVNIEGKDYAVVVCEVNWRLTGAYASCMIQGLYGDSLENSRISNINTVEFEKKSHLNYQQLQNQIILKLKESGLLFDPSSDKNKHGIYPFSIHEDKIQVAVVSEDSEKEKVYLQKLKKVLEEI